MNKENNKDFVLQVEDGKPRKMAELQSRLFEISVKAVVVRNRDEILLIKRAKDSSALPDKYDLPGGKLEDGENLYYALEREVQEEAGIKITTGPIIHVHDFEKTYSLADHDGRKYRLNGKALRLIARYESGDVNLSKEHQSYEWIKIDKAIEKLESEGFEKTVKDALSNAKEFLEMRQALDSWKRCQADFENYKKKQLEWQSEFKKFATEQVVLDFLPVLDNFEASLEHVPQDKASNGWVQGINYIAKQLADTFKQNGVSEIETKVGDKFDPAIHEAVGGEAKKQKVSKIIRKGYRLHGKIVRAARVEVA